MYDSAYILVVVLHVKLPAKKLVYIYMHVAFDVFACVLRAIYFWDFICLKSIYFPGFFSHRSLNGPMRFSHPVDTTDRRNTKVHLGV